MDGTFKLVTKPFTQLWAINGFLKNQANVIKQVPFVFVLMTRGRSSDYSAVFDFLLQQLHLPKVQEVMSDFERAVFKTVANKLPEVQHNGCYFHWCQAVMKKVRDLGLFPAFCRVGPTKDAINFLLTLPLLPASKIRGVFAFWQGKVNLPTLNPLIAYVNRTTTQRENTTGGIIVVRVRSCRFMN